jgi:mono/diheme cytochrome c family protein
MRLTLLALTCGAVALAAGPWVATAASLGERVVVSDLSEAAARGQAAFDTYCATCHGSDAGGTNSGPPLVHKIYHPGHHADIAFLLAVRQGSRAHHWSFGDMPPVEGVSDAELVDIIAFVREVQRANGIF